MSEEDADKIIKESTENSPKSDNEKNVSNKTDEEISSNSDEVNSKDKSSGDKSETTKSQGKNRRNGRNNKGRERHELPPNVDNLPPLSLKVMQEKDINDIKLIAEECELQDFAGNGKHQLIFELLKKKRAFGWILKMNKEQIINSNIFLGKYINK